MAEHQLPKLNTGVRFPSSALFAQVDSDLAWQIILSFSAGHEAECSALSEVWLRTFDQVTASNDVGVASQSARSTKPLLHGCCTQELRSA